jgi:hypothetical protein
MKMWNILVVLCVVSATATYGCEAEKDEVEENPILATGTLTVEEVEYQWFCWYDNPTSTLVFATNYQADESFETALQKAEEELEGQVSVEDPRVIQVTKGFEVGGCRIETGTIFYFRLPEPLVAEAVEAINDHKVVDKMEID